MFLMMCKKLHRADKQNVLIVSVVRDVENVNIVVTAINVTTATSVKIARIVKIAHTATTVRICRIKCMFVMENNTPTNKRISWLSLQL